MLKVARWTGQAIAYGAFAVVVGYFSNSPAYRYANPDAAQIKLSFSHAGQIKGECRQLSPEEIAALPPNMRRPADCPRERWPITVELSLDGTLLYRGSHPPAGLWGDGPSPVYQRFSVVPGPHRLTARLRDGDPKDGFDYSETTDILLEPGQNFVVDFRSDIGTFVFH